MGPRRPCFFHHWLASFTRQDSNSDVNPARMNMSRAESRLSSSWAVRGIRPSSALGSGPQARTSAAASCSDFQEERTGLGYWEPFSLHVNYDTSLDQYAYMAEQLATAWRRNADMRCAAPILVSSFNCGCALRSWPVLGLEQAGGQAPDHPDLNVACDREDRPGKTY